MNSKEFSDKNTELESENIDSGLIADHFSSEDCDYDSQKFVGDAHEAQVDSGLDLHISDKCDSAIHTPTPRQQPQPVLPVTVVDEPPIELPPLALLVQQDEDGETALHVSAYHGCEKVISALINVCSDEVWLDLHNDYGQTALHLAAGSGHAVVTRMLVKAGANIGIRDVTGSTPLHLAAAKGHSKCLQALLSHVPEHPTRRMASILNQKNYDGQMAVHVAASNGHMEALRTLVYYGADINEREGLSGWTALHIAAVRGDERTASFLVEKCPGVAVNAKDYGGRTPARYARNTKAASALAKHMDDYSDTEDDEDDDDLYDDDGFVNLLAENFNTINVA